MPEQENIEEEGIVIPSYGSDITKELHVFYNPEMKLNRDFSILALKTYFKEKKIKYCDPMAASGIREIRFQKAIPEVFDKITCGDISKSAVKNIKRNFKRNKASLKNVELIVGNAINTISKEFYDCIEIDPFGSPVPFLDIALQRVKHNGLICVTATDTGTLSGTYPKTCYRRYGIKVEKTHYHEELGLRNLIAYCIREGAKYEKTLRPVLSYSYRHYFRIFFEVHEGRSKTNDTLSQLKYIKWDSKTQETKILENEEKGALGRTYVGPINDKEFLKQIYTSLDLLEDNKKAQKLLDKLNDELDIVGYVNPHKLEKEFKFSSKVRYEELFEELRKKKHKVSRAHNEPYGIKTTASHKMIIKIMKKKLN